MSELHGTEGAGDKRRPGRLVYSEAPVLLYWEITRAYAKSGDAIETDPLCAYQPGIDTSEVPHSTRPPLTSPATAPRAIARAPVQ